MSPQERGVSLVVVLVIVVVLLFGVLALSRITETAVSVAGNQAYKDASREAAELGLAQAHEALTGMATDDTSIAPWYYAAQIGDDKDGLPTLGDWTAAPQVPLENYDVRYIVERLCRAPLPVTDYDGQCLLRKQDAIVSAKTGTEALQAPDARQFRITVRVLGPQRTQTWVQSTVVR